MDPRAGKTIYLNDHSYTVTAQMAYFNESDCPPTARAYVEKSVADTLTARVAELGQIAKESHDDGYEAGLFDAQTDIRHTPKYQELTARVKELEGELQELNNMWIKKWESVLDSRDPLITENEKLTEALRVCEQVLQDIASNDYAFKPNYSAEEFAQTALDKIKELIK